MNGHNEDLLAVLKDIVRHSIRGKHAYHVATDDMDKARAIIAKVEAAK